MMIKLPEIRDKALMTAIAVSLAWHVLWLSAIKIVSAPPDAAPHKFSKVSFLGPIAGRGAIEVRSARGEISFLEERYMAALGMPAVPGSGSADRSAIPAGKGGDMERGMSVFIEKSLEGEKLSPGTEIASFRSQ